ncbi:MAG: DUF1207 domain-containing protein [Bacteroidota bacterium]|nr:DUF1207 domain-containing protein [Bacteroidota bacterium]
MIRKQILLISFVLICFAVFSQTTGNKEYQFQWLPKAHLFEPVYQDPTENQIYGGLYLYWFNEEFQDRIYASYSLGFQREIMRWEQGPDRGFEFGIAATTFTQFEFLRPRDFFQSNLLNNDFKVGGQFNYRDGKISLRVRYWHVSAHMGDDFIFRYNVPGYYINPVIYEQADILFSQEEGIFRFYGGLGIVTHVTYERERASVQLGFNFKKSFRNENFRWIGGIDSKYLEEYHYRPNINAVFGMELGKPQNKPLRLMLQYYNGHLPYSLYEFVTVQWLGLSMSFNAF